MWLIMSDITGDHDVTYVIYVVWCTSFTLHDDIIDDVTHMIYITF